MRFDVIVVGGANQDFIVQGKQLPKAGESLGGVVFQESPGGKGANQAIAAARLGAKVAFFGKLGRGRDGDLILDGLRSEGVDVSRVLRDPTKRSGATLVSIDERGQKQTHFVPGANSDLTPEEVFRASPLLNSGAVLLTQLEIPYEASFAAIRIAAGAKLKVVLDPAPPLSMALPEEILMLTDVVRMNSDEARTLTGVEVKDRDSARVAAEKLLWDGAGAVVIEAGSEENLLLYNDHEIRLPNYPLQRVDTTGSGDAFSAAIAVALSEGHALSEAAMFGSAAAGLASTVLGAQASLPDRGAVIQLLKQDGIDFPDRKRARKPSPKAA